MIDTHHELRSDVLRLVLGFLRSSRNLVVRPRQPPHPPIAVRTRSTRFRVKVKTRTVAPPESDDGLHPPKLTPAVGCEQPTHKIIVNPPCAYQGQQNHATGPARGRLRPTAFPSHCPPATAVVRRGTIREPPAASTCWTTASSELASFERCRSASAREPRAATRRRRGGGDRHTVSFVYRRPRRGEAITTRVP